MDGDKKAQKSTLWKAFDRFMAVADRQRRMGVWANADTPDQAKKSRVRGATGIGLCRTEHMFMGEERVQAVRQMIFADTEAEEAEAYKALLPLQRKDFEGIFKAMDGYPVTVRLLDPPLHEFLPNHVELAVAVSAAEEFRRMKDELEPEVRAIIEKKGVDLDIPFGTMIELPRAALRAGEIAEDAEFFSFGTNDLTQTTYGFSRDDIGKFLAMYEELKLVGWNPFVTIDDAGVGRLMKIAVEEGRATNPELHLGICGEHGGDPDSVTFCEGLGLDYVSCSTYRVPTARLAAAQAVMGEATTSSK
jgi:pyruvate,orthophosphate dikinase